MAKRDIGTEILEGIREVKAHQAGKVKLKTHRLKELPPTQEIRKRLKLDALS